jgi:hypothetical protein
VPLQREQVMRQLHAACPDDRIAPDELAARAAAQGADIIAGLRRITGAWRRTRRLVPGSYGFFGMAAAPAPMT